MSLTLFILAFASQFIMTITYSVRIVGLRTNMLALSFSIFNIIALVANTANSFQGPLLAKYLERNILQSGYDPVFDFRVLLLIASAGCLAGAFSIPTVQRL